MLDQIKLMEIIIFILLICGLSGQETFPKIVWIYWEQGYQNAPLFTQLAINNKQRYASKSGWEVNILSDDNLYQYIDRNQLNAKISSLNLKEDIIRLMLLYKYGGMWLDANTILIRDLSWIDQISQDKYVRNKMSSHPQLLMIANTSTNQQLFSSSKNEDKQLINIFPEYLNWFILAKPKSIFLESVLLLLQEMLATTKQQIQQKLQSQGIISQQRYLNPLLMGSDYLFRIVIERKQNQLLMQIGQYAVKQYNIWHFQANQTTYHYTIQNGFRPIQLWADFINNYIEELPLTIKENAFLWKFDKQQAMQFSRLLENYEQINCWGGDLIIKQESQIYQQFFYEAENDISLAIDEVLNNKDRDYCKKLIDKKYQQSNYEFLINIIAQGDFIIAVFIIFACTIFFSKTSQNLAKQNTSNA